ncbi:hypothetical protein LXL04_031464 [Taraxacum kok-saghyz]
MAATSSSSAASEESQGTNSSATLFLPNSTHNQFFVWREFLWGALAGGFGEGMMHPIDTVKTRIQSQAILTQSQKQKSILQMVKAVWGADGLRGFYRGVAPGVTGSLVTGATYFGVIESTKKWMEETHPNLGGHWAHFIAGDTLGSFIYVPCEVIKQRMQVQGTRNYWTSVVMKDAALDSTMYAYYSGMFQAGCSIWKDQGPKGLYAGYWSTLVRDVPFAGLMVTCYERIAGGVSAYLTTPLDVIKTRLQVQGPIVRYNGWMDAFRRIWLIEGAKGFFRGSIPRVIWYVPASALTFMAVEFLRDQFNERRPNTHKVKEVTTLILDKNKPPLQQS